MDCAQSIAMDVVVLKLKMKNCFWLAYDQKMVLKSLIYHSNNSIVKYICSNVPGTENELVLITLWNIFPYHSWLVGLPFVFFWFIYWILSTRRSLSRRFPQQWGNCLSPKSILGSGSKEITWESMDTLLWTSWASSIARSDRTCLRFPCSTRIEYVACVTL